MVLLSYSTKSKATHVKEPRETCLCKGLGSQLPRGTLQETAGSLSEQNSDEVWTAPETFQDQLVLGWIYLWFTVIQ